MKSALVILMVLCLTLPAASAFAAGGVDGGGGGGNAVPDQDGDGPGLTRIFKEGIDFLVEGECKLAEKKFQRVLKKVPRNSQANYLRGVALQCQKKHKQAVRYFKRAKRDDAHFYRAYAELGLSYLILDRPDLASTQMAELDRMKSTCRDNCPANLLKSVAKLRNALDRIQGSSVDSEKTDQHGLNFDRVEDSFYNADYLLRALASDRCPEAFPVIPAATLIARASSRRRYCVTLGPCLTTHPSTFAPGGLIS